MWRCCFPVSVKICLCEYVCVYSAKVCTEIGILSCFYLRVRVICAYIHPYIYTHCVQNFYLLQGEKKRPGHILAQMKHKICIWTPARSSCRVTELTPQFNMNARSKSKQRPPFSQLFLLCNAVTHWHMVHKLQGKVFLACGDWDFWQAVDWGAGVGRLISSWDEIIQRSFLSARMTF